MQKALKWGAIAVAALAAILVASLLLVDVNQFREPIQRKLEASIGRSVKLGQMSLRLLPPSFAIDHVSIAEDPAFSAVTPFLVAKEIRVSAKLLPLLAGDLEISSIGVVQPTVELIRNPSGIWNFASLGREASSSGAPTKRATGAGFTLGELSLVEGKVGFTDHQTKKARVVYDRIDLQLRDFGPNRPLKASATFHLPQDMKVVVRGEASYDERSQVLRLAGAGAQVGAATISMDGTVSLAHEPAALDLTVKAGKASMAELARAAAAAGIAFAPDMKVSGDLNADVRIGGSSERPELRGSIAARAIEVMRTGWKQPVRLAELRLDLTPDAIRSNPFRIESGGTGLTGSLAIAGYSGQNASIDARLAAQNAKLNELLNVAAAYGFRALDGQGASGTVSVDVRLTGPVRRPAYSGSGLVENANLPLPGLNKPFRIERANVRFSEDRAILEQLSGSLGNTNLKGSASVRDFAKPVLEFRASLDKINVAEWQAAISSPPARSRQKQERGAAASGKRIPITGAGTVEVGQIVYGAVSLKQVRSDCVIRDGVIRLDPLTAEIFGGRKAGRMIIDTNSDPVRISLRARFERVDANQLLSATTSLKQMVFGSLFADTDVEFASQPGEEVARGLNGSAKLVMTDGKLTGVNLLNEIARVGKFLGYSEDREPSTSFVKMAGNLRFENGVAGTEDLKLELPYGAITAAGVIGLADSSTRLNLTAVLSKEYSSKFGGNRMGGWMSTVLGNPQGEIVMPLLVNGKLPRPQFLPDPERFAKLKLEQMLPTTRAATSVIESVLGSITGKRDPKPEAKESPKEDAGQSEEAKQEPSAQKKLTESLFDLFRKKKQ